MPAAAEEAAALTDAEVVRRSFFPMTFPLTTGPGTIAAAIALGAQIPTTARRGVPARQRRAGRRGGPRVPGALLPVQERRLGAAPARSDIGTLVMMRLMAFILLCVGIQIMWNGWAELNAITP